MKITCIQLSNPFFRCFQLRGDGHHYHYNSLIPSLHGKPFLHQSGLLSVHLRLEFNYSLSLDRSFSLVTSIFTKLDVFEHQSSSVATYRILFELWRRFFVLLTHQNKLFSKPILGPSWLNFINVRPLRHFLSSPQASTIHQVLSIIESTWALIAGQLATVWGRGPLFFTNGHTLVYFYAHNFETSPARWRHLPMLLLNLA